MWKFIKETKTTAKMGKYEQKSQNFVWKLVVTKARIAYVKKNWPKN